jgi:hypothetical protein
MSDRLQEIANLLARAKDYCASIPEDDVRRKTIVGPIDSLCTAITTAVQFIRTPGTAQLGAIAAAQWAGRIDKWCAQVEEWLARGRSFELAQEIGRERRKRSQQARDAASRPRPGTKSKLKEKLREQKRVLADYQKKVISERSLPKYRHMRDREYCKERTRD